MLGKLLKHEWKSIWKIPTLLIVILLVVTAAVGVSFNFPIWESDMEGLELLVVMLFMLFYALLVGASIGVMLYLAVHFYKSMYTDEGYLTHTLPVTPRQLLVSKILPATAWVYLSGFAVLLAVMVFTGMLMVEVKPTDTTLLEFINSLREEIKLAYMDLWHDGMSSFLISLLVMAIVSGFSSVMMIVASITIGQMVSKHKILGSIGAYFGINMVVNIISTFAMMPIMAEIFSVNESNVFEFFSFACTTSTIVAVIITIVLYIISELILRKKLNLD